MKGFKKALAVNLAIVTMLGSVGVATKPVSASPESGINTTSTDADRVTVTYQTDTYQGVFNDEFTSCKYVYDKGIINDYGVPKFTMNDEFAKTHVLVGYVVMDPNGHEADSPTVDEFVSGYQFPKEFNEYTVYPKFEEMSLTKVNWTILGENYTETGTYEYAPTTEVGDTTFTIDMIGGIPEGYALDTEQNETGFRTIKIGEKTAVTFLVKKLPVEEKVTTVNWTILGENIAETGTYEYAPTTEVGDTTFTIDMVGGIPEGYALDTEHDETGFRTIKIGEETAVTFLVKKLPVEEHVTTVNWTVFGEDGLVLTGTYESEPTTEVGDMVFNFAEMIGLPEGYQFVGDEDGTRIMKIGSTEAFTFIVDKIPAQEFVTTVNWTILGENIAETGTYEYAPTTEVGDTTFTIDMIGGIPEGYALDTEHDETGFRTIKIGEETAVTFLVKKLPVEEHVTTVNWTILGENIAETGTYVFEPTTEVGDTFFNIDMIGGIPEGYALSEGEDGTRVIKIGEETAITFLVDKLPVEEQVTKVNWTILGENYTETGTYEYAPTTEVGDTFFTIDMIGGIPEGYTLSEGEDGTRVIKIGEETAITFLVDKLPTEPTDPTDPVEPTDPETPTTPDQPTDTTVSTADTANVAIVTAAAALSLVGIIVVLLKKRTLRG